MTTWFIADLHFAHDSIIRLSQRQFVDSTDMGNYFIDRINSYVKSGDHLWILGDFCTRNLEVATFWRKKIKHDNVNLIMGNHDRGNYRNLFKKVCDSRVVISINKQGVVLDHYPLLAWLKSDKGYYMLHGHCHSNLNSFIQKCMPNSRILDVGVDNLNKFLGDYRPISFEEVKEHMDKIVNFTTPDIIGYKHLKEA